jgi:uncharacterized protein (DUF1778 family)
MPERRNRTEKLDLRLTPAAKQTLQAAAAAERKSVSEFILDSALSQAEERLADRHIFTLDAKSWDAFATALDAPRAAMLVLSGCSASLLFSAPKANRDAIAPHREVGADSCRRAFLLRATGA